MCIESDKLLAGMCELYKLCQAYVLVNLDTRACSHKHSSLISLPQGIWGEGAKDNLCPSRGCNLPPCEILSKSVRGEVTNSYFCIYILSMDYGFGILFSPQSHRQNRYEQCSYRWVLTFYLKPVIVMFSC